MKTLLRLPALVLLIVLGAGLVALASSSASGTETADDGKAAAKRAKGKVVTRNLDIPWGLDFLPNGTALVTQRSRATISKVARKGGKARRVMRVPGVDQNAGEGGLLGLAVSPNYRKNGFVYAYLTTTSDNRIVRFKLGRPGTIKVIAKGMRRSSIHNGGRIAFGPDGKLYAGVGDAAEPSLAQQKNSRNGKILRFNPDGSTPKTNPFGKRSKVWSYGHRNVQGFAWDRKGRMWASELGQNTFDEVNLIRRGNNYGWPVREGKGGTDNGRFTNPKVTWRPSEASPSGAAIKGRKLYVAALRGERLWTIGLRGTKTKKPVARFNGRYGRIRTVERAPDGSLWLATANGGGNDVIVRVPSGKRRG
ncbi:PQQ-dependent sugar dehydrogenase [Thermoleophilia bacterium SCSIO 60948]|nr:PQQ-dependent sugar dehydrogenase [Thermoleophilia bacterium SCSIO 60948]